MVENVGGLKCDEVLIILFIRFNLEVILVKKFKDDGVYVSWKVVWKEVWKLKIEFKKVVEFEMFYRNGFVF